MPLFFLHSFSLEDEKTNVTEVSPPNGRGSVQHTALSNSGFVALAEGSIFIQLLCMSELW
jgi:hypothetical protein